MLTLLFYLFDYYLFDFLLFSVIFNIFLQLFPATG